MDEYNSEAKGSDTIKESYNRIDAIAEQHGLIEEAVRRMKKYCTGVAVTEPAYQ